MENIVTIIASAVLSGVLATIVTLWWQNRSEKIKTRKEIFITLMAYRYKISHAETVKALNCIQAVFYDCEGVRKAWSKFKVAVDRKPPNGIEIDDAYITLLEEIAKVLKCKNVNWQDIKGYYFPQRLDDEMKDIELLRKAQIEAIYHINENKKKSEESGQVDRNDNNQ